MRLKFGHFESAEIPPVAQFILVANPFLTRTPVCLFSPYAYQFMNFKLILKTIFLILILLFGAAPAWPYSRGWGYGPSGILGVVLIILLVMLLLDVIRWI